MQRLAALASLARNISRAWRLWTMGAPRVSTDAGKPRLGFENHVPPLLAARPRRGVDKALCGVARVSQSR